MRNFSLTSTVELLELLHKAIARYRVHPNPVLSNRVNTVVSLLAFNLRKPYIRLKPEQKLAVDYLKAELGLGNIHTSQRKTHEKVT